MGSPTYRRKPSSLSPKRSASTTSGSTSSNISPRTTIHNRNTLLSFADLAPTEKLYSGDITQTDVHATSSSDHHKNEGSTAIHPKSKFKLLPSNTNERKRDIDFVRDLGIQKTRELKGKNSQLSAASPVFVPSRSFSPAFRQVSAIRTPPPSSQNFRIQRPALQYTQSVSPLYQHSNMMGYNPSEVRNPRAPSSFIAPSRNQNPRFKSRVIVPGAPLGPRNPNLDRNIYNRPRQLPHDPRAPTIPAPPSTIAKAASPIKPPRTFLAKLDKDKKDLIITADGITRNAVYVTERYLPNGETYQTFGDDFSHEKGYDFVTAVEAMSKELKEELFENLAVEIIVDIEPPTVDNGEQKMIENGGGLISTPKSTEQVDSVTNTSNPAAHHSRHKATDLSHAIANSSTTTLKQTPPKPTILTQLSKLNPTLQPLIKKLHLTLSFPHPPSTPSPSHPLSSTHLHTTPSWNHLLLLTPVLDTFTSLTSLNINLLVPSNTRTALTMEQIYHLLPFYDLRFVKWEMTFQCKGMGVRVPLRGWCVKQLDRERERVVRERKRGELVVVDARRRIEVGSGLVRSGSGNSGVRDRGREGQRKAKKPISDNDADS